MGFFSRLAGHVKDLNNMAIAVGNVIALLDRYDETNDGYALLIAAWLCKRGIQDVVAAGNLSPVHTINVFVNQRLEKMTVQDAYIKSIGRLSMIAKEMSDQDSEDILDMLPDNISENISVEIIDDIQKPCSLNFLDFFVESCDTLIQ